MFEHDNEERESRRTFSRRAMVLAAGQMLGFSVLGWRLFELQVLDEGRYDPLADENRTSLQILLPKRGRILDRTGAVLADNDESFRVVITPALAGDIPGVLAKFKLLQPLNDAEVDAIVKRAKRQSRNLPIAVATDVPFEQVARINLFAPQLPGIRTEVAWRRRYHSGAAAGHLVGYTGSIERPSIDDDALMRMPGVRIGKSGVEAGMEMELRGDGGIVKIEVDARGRIKRNLEMRDPVAGRDVHLTIDLDLQKRMFERLRAERCASCVVLDVTTGEIAAMASTPSYDPAELTDGPTEETWQRLSAAEDKPLLNRAIGGIYPPGSTFKIVTALALLHMRAMDPKEKINCGGRYELAGHSYRCWKRSGHGPVALHDALRESCDCYFYEAARRLGIDAIADMARMMGFGQVYNCGLPQQKAGLVADPDWKRGRWNAGWYGGETLLAGIGQGYMLATPLQLAIMTARIATNRAVEPTIVKYSNSAPGFRFAELGLEPDKVALVRAGMKAVVNEEAGTGKNAVLGAGRPLVAGKTGTSQTRNRGDDRPQDDLPWRARDHALFVAYFPADAPRYAVAAVVEHGGGGGAVAAPLVRDVIEAVLDVDSRRTSPTNSLEQHLATPANARPG